MHRAPSNVSFWPVADMAAAGSDVRFRGQSGPGRGGAECRHLTQSGSWARRPTRLVGAAAAQSTFHWITIHDHHYLMPHGEPPVRATKLSQAP
jgi:hypothetical protein